jgi:hypothetical protein
MSPQLTDYELETAARAGRSATYPSNVRGTETHDRHASQVSRALRWAPSSPQEAFARSPGRKHPLVTNMQRIMRAQQAQEEQEDQARAPFRNVKG